MATLALLSPPKSFFPCKFSQTHPLCPTLIQNSRVDAIQRNQTLKPNILSSTLQNKIAMASLLGAGFSLTTIVGPASASELQLLGSSLQLTEPPNALSLPTWAIHVSSVVEW